MLIKCRELANVSWQNPFPLNGAQPVYASWTSGVNIFFSVYAVLLIIKGIGITKHEFLMLHKRTCTVFLSGYMLFLCSLLPSADCRNAIFTRENTVLTFCIHLISLCNGISSRAARYELDFLSLSRIQQTSLHQFYIFKHLPGRRYIGFLLSSVTALWWPKSKMVCCAIKPLSVSSLLFSSGEWNHGPHLKLIPTDQIIVSGQLLFVKLQCDKWDLSVEAAAWGCCVRGRSPRGLCRCLGEEAGGSVFWGGHCPGPLAWLPRCLKWGRRLP